jgi:hypothetical protein
MDETFEHRIFKNYEINECCIIRHKDSKIPLTYQLNDNGYYNVNVYDDDEKKIILSVSRAVISTFVGSPPNNDFKSYTADQQCIMLNLFEKYKLLKNFIKLTVPDYGYDNELNNTKRKGKNKGNDKGNDSQQRPFVAQKDDKTFPFDSLSEAVQWLRENGHENVIFQKILKCLNGKTQKAYEYTWSYTELHSDLTPPKDIPSNKYRKKYI